MRRGNLHHPLCHSQEFGVVAGGRDSLIFIGFTIPQFQSL